MDFHNPHYFHNTKIPMLSYFKRAFYWQKKIFIGFKFSMIVNFISNNKCVQKSSPPVFSGKVKSIASRDVLQTDTFKRNFDNLKSKMLELRQAYLEQNPDAFITLDHIKSNYDNSFVVKSVVNQTKDLQAVSTDDFCNLSEIMKSIRLPEAVTVYRAMEANDFNIGRLKPEDFIKEYFEDGKNVVVPIYMSTSLDKNIAFRFAKDNPYRFIIKLNVPQNHPAVYMEELTPNDGEYYGYEEEINVIKNSEVILKNLKKIKNPLNNKEIYQIEGDVVGFKDVKPPKRELVMDEEMLELLNALKNI